MHYLSPSAYAYFSWCGHVFNQGQQNFGGLLYVGLNCSNISDDNNNNNNNHHHHHHHPNHNHNKCKC